MNDDDIAEIRAAAEFETRIAAYDGHVREQLRVLGVDPTCLLDPDLYDIVGLNFGAGISPADTARDIVKAMDETDAADVRDGRRRVLAHATRLLG